jgi:hypothetical protein
MSHCSLRVEVPAVKGLWGWGWGWGWEFRFTISHAPLGVGGHHRSGPVGLGLGVEELGLLSCSHCKERPAA